MSQTADSFFYSLESNALAPPPYSPSLPGAPQIDIESGDEKQREDFTNSFVRRFTPPFLRTSSTLPADDRASTAPSVWNKFTTRLSDLVVDWWLWELFSWFLSALCVFGIAVLLGYWNGRAVPDRFPLGITLSASIAVLSGIAKYALIVPIDSALGQLRWHWFAQKPRPLMDFEHFDDASRGPWGAANLLVRTKGRTIASIGVIVTLLSLAMDPFFQQLVDLPKRPSELGRSAVPRMVDFTLQRNTFQNSTSNEDVIAPDRLMQDIVFSFMVNNGTDREVSAFCPSEDCSWKPFDTLALCSACTDVSDMLTLACLEESGDWRKNASVEVAGPKTFSCGYFANATSDNPILMSGYAVDTNSTPAAPSEFLLMRNLNLHDPNVDKTYWGGSINYGNPGFPLVDFIQAASPDPASVLRGDKPVARECVLQWCTKRVLASYDAGQYSEQILSQSFDAGPAFDPLNFGDDLFFTYDKNISISPPDSNSTFTIRNDTTLSTIFLFQDFFPAYLTAANDTATPLLRTRNILGQSPRHWLYASNPFASMDGGNEYITKMAETVTTLIRTYPGSSELFRGTGGMETFISVRWGYFALPVVLVCLTLGLLVAVILENRRNTEIGVWKSSILASMVHGLDDKARSTLQSTSRLSDVFKHAKMLNVKLRTEQNRGQLKLYIDDRH